MKRRLFLLLAVAAWLAAGLNAGPRPDSEKDARDLIQSLADALSAGKSALFLDAFDRSLPDYDKLRTNVEGLLSQGDVSCNIEITSNDGDDSERTLTLDWIVSVEPKEVSPGSKRWEKKAKCRIRKMGKKWKIVEFDPVDLFAAPVG